MKANMMHALSSPFQYIRCRSAHKKQKRNALHMLALSGAVRASHVELRYMTPLANLTASRLYQASMGQQQTYPVPLRSCDLDSALNVKQTLQWARRFSSSLMHLAKNRSYFDGPSS
jgi:hypothetical protein